MCVCVYIYIYIYIYMKYSDNKLCIYMDHNVKQISVG